MTGDSRPEYSHQEVKTRKRKEKQEKEEASSEIEEWVLEKESRKRSGNENKCL